MSNVTLKKIPHLSATAESRLLLVIITLLGAGLRFYKLGEWSLWIEEHHSVRDAVAFDWSLSAIFSSIRPLYFMFLAPSLDLFGVTEWSARLVSAIFGVLTIPLVYYISRRIINLNHYVALGATLLMAVAPWHIYWSQNARFYTLLLLLSTGSTWAFYWGVETNRQRYIYLSIILIALAGITHTIAAILPLIYLVYLILLKLLRWEQPPGANIRNLAPVIWLPLLGYMLIEIIRVFVLQQRTIIEAVYFLFFNEATASFIGYGSPYVMITSVLYYVGTPLVFFSLIGAWITIQRQERMGLMLSLSAYLPLLLLSLLTLFASTANRYVFLSTFNWIILGMVGLSEAIINMKNGRGRFFWLLPILLILLLRDPAIRDMVYYFRIQPAFRFMVLTILVVVGIVFYFTYRSYLTHIYPAAIFVTLLTIFAHPILMDTMYYAYQNGHRDNWKAASSIILSGREPDDLVVSSVPPLASYYLGNNVIGLAEVELGQLQHDGSRTWFVEDFGVDLVDGDQVIAEWLANNCSLVGNFDQFVANRNWKLRVHHCVH